MEVDRNAAWTATVVALAGIALHAYTAVFNAGPVRWPVATLGLMVWSSLPYAICIGLVARENAHPLIAMCAAALALAVDIAAYVFAFVRPTGIDPDHVLLVVPLVNLLVALPAGFALGRRLERRQRR